MNPWTPPHRGVAPESPVVLISTEKVSAPCRATLENLATVHSSRLNAGS